jgi:hypothetical protein
MILKKLQVELQTYGPDKGRHVGEIQFTGDAGCVTLNLTPDLCNKIFDICAEGLIETAKEAAHNLTCNVIEHQKTLSHADGK